MSPTSDSIGNQNVHLNGKKFASVCTQPGISCSGTSRPESSSSAAMYRSNTAAPRVVQKFSIPIVS